MLIKIFLETRNTSNLLFITERKNSLQIILIRCNILICHILNFIPKLRKNVSYTNIYNAELFMYYFIYEM